MSSGNGNPLGNRGRGPENRMPHEDPAMNPWLNPSEGGDAPRSGRFSDPTSRRRFLRAAVAAGAVVAGTGVVGGIVAANRKPGIVSTTLAGNTQPSGHCVMIKEAVHGTASNPNHHIQILTSDFTTYVGTITVTPGNPPVFTIVHPYATLSDKRNPPHLPDVTVCIKSATYKQGNTGQVSLFVDPGIVTPKGDEYPEGCCLYVSQTRTC
ncbi:MAG TPA: hypothetical protein VFU88_20540 [Ktedonobacterales bacterium]|nr:hypothetical protein [Ktedonobacterales bacterium]